MRTLRTALTAAALCLLCAGYAASQFTYFFGNFADYAARVDTPPVQHLALALLLLAVILAFIREKDDPRQTDSAETPQRRNAASPDPSVDSRFTIHDLRVKPQ